MQSALPTHWSWRRHRKQVVTAAVAFAFITFIALTSIFGVPGAGATSHGTSGNGIEPEISFGNMTCSQLAGPGQNWIELKVDPPEEGVFSDGNLTVEITNLVDTKTFNWSSNIGVDAVFVKAGTAGGNYLYRYDPPSESMGDTGLTSPGDGITNQISHISFCYDLELEVSKTAETTFTRTFEWNIEKSVTPETWNLFDGESGTSKYTVAVTKTGFTDSDGAVSGTITIHNPWTMPATIEDVSDSISGIGDVAVDCGVGFPHPLAAGGTLECTYSSPLPSGVNRVNTATVETSGDISGGEATADVVFGEPTTVVNDTINVDDTNGMSWEFSDTGNVMYDVTFECGTDSGMHTNVATIRETDQSDDAKVTVNCYELAVTKTADVQDYTVEYAWMIEKNGDEEYFKWIGETWEHVYDIDLTRLGIASETATIFGTITIDNSTNPIPATINSVSDVVSGLDPDVIANVNCGGAFPMEIAAFSSLDCSYTADVEGSGYDLNTATAVQQLYDYASDGTATAAVPPTASHSGFAVVDFPDTPDEIVPVNITDDYGTPGDDPEDTIDDIPFGPFTNSAFDLMYDRDLNCSTDTSLYAGDGHYSYEIVNTATIDETGQSDDATVVVNCYAPVISKDADASYDERHTWDIEKEVTPTDQSGYPGDKLEWTWTVTLSETSVDENFMVVGEIKVTNPANSPGDMTVDLADVLNDVPATVADVDCDPNTDGNQSSVTVAPGSMATCDYKAVPDDASATLNTATGTFRGFGFVATADVDFVKTVLNGTAVVNDDQEPDFNPDGLNVSIDDDPLTWIWTETQSHTCSEDRSAYGDSGMYNATLNNLATVDGSNGDYDEAFASTTYTCEASFVDILKTTNGELRPDLDIRFRLYDGNGTDLNDEVSTLGDPDGQLQFQTALVPGASYTVCESPVPAGYTFQITINGGLVQGYAGPPGAVDPTGEIQCFDFIAADSPTTLVFEVENSFPGGGPRTPGYWKNWNTCSGGNQAETAAKLGGTVEGIYILEDLLPQTVGDLVLVEGNCEDAVAILDAKDIGSGKKMSNDAAYVLARAMLAAQLNQAANACVATQTFNVAGVGNDLTFTQVMAAAQALLVDQGFDGSGNFLGPKDKSGDREIALQLAGIIDAYNNGELCDGTPSH